MAQCEGITKSGARCRRPAGRDSAFCSTHTDQAAASGRKTADGPETTAGSGDAPGAGRASGSGDAGAPARARGSDSFARLALIGVITLGLLALRRVIRG